MIDFVVDDKRIKADMRKMLRTISPKNETVRKMMLRIGQNQRSYILDRTLRGLSYQGRKFKSYSPAYARRKSKYGEGRVSAKIGIVDLSLTGLMLKSLGVKIVEPGTVHVRGGIIGMGTHAELLDYHQEGRGHLPKRPILGWNRKDIEKHEKLINKFAEEALK